MVVIFGLKMQMLGVPEVPPLSLAFQSVHSLCSFTLQPDNNRPINGKKTFLVSIEGLRQGCGVVRGSRLERDLGRGGGSHGAVGPVLRGRRLRRIHGELFLPQRHVRR